MERIWVSDGTRDRSHSSDNRQLALRAVQAYMYSGWEYDGWGTAPEGSVFRESGYTGFYFTRTDDSSGDGFGAEILLDRLASGLHFGTLDLDVEADRVAYEAALAAPERV